MNKKESHNLYGMYDLEIYVGESYPPLNSKESHREALITYEEEKIRINLTRIWHQSDVGERYGDFLDEFIGAIIHEFLHYFFYINGMLEENTEEIAHYLSRNLMILSRGHLIGAGGEETEEDKAYFQEWINHQFPEKQNA